MVLGADLWREKPEWDGGGSFLLLNPRMEAEGRERVLAGEFPDWPGQVWIGSSGTGGRLKVVALSRAALEASARAVNQHLGVTRDDVWLNVLPLFHVGGLGTLVRSVVAGGRWVNLEGWDAAAFVRTAAAQGATCTALVPTQVHDLVRGGHRAPAGLRAVVVGGGRLDEALDARARALGWPLGASYGLTEFGSQVATARPGAAAGEWWPLLPHAEARTTGEGVLELRGPSLLTGWMLFGGDGRARWEDPKVDGWFRTNDRVELRGRDLRFVGRVDDLVKIRGELVDVAALEAALQARVAEGRVAVHCVPDERNGVALRVVAANAAALKQARALRDEIFPPYARPPEFVEGPVEVTALGKTVHRPR